MQQITATYSFEDNKIRLYPSERLAPELYERVKNAGFKWAPAQKLFVAPTWTPEQERKKWHRRSYNMDEIRSRYDSGYIKTNARLKLAGS